MKHHSMLWLTLLATVLIAGCSQAEKPPEQEVIRPVKLYEVSESAANQIHKFPAKVTANSRAELSFRVSGQLVKLDLVEGEQVKKGFLLAMLDDRDAKNNLMTSEANYEFLSAEFTRNQAMFSRQLISQAEFDSSKAQLKTAKAALEAAKDQLSYTRLEAPFSGTIAKRMVDNHQIVQANQGILTLQNNHLLDISIQVPEAIVAKYAQKVTHSLKAKVRFSAMNDREFDAQFKEYSTQVTPGTQAYEVVFSLEQPKDVQLLPGMSAELVIVQSANDHGAFTAIVPITAVDKDDSNGMVTVWKFDATTGEVNPVDVTIGRVSNEGVEVLTGLNKGDLIVAAGISQLATGMKVKPLRWQRGV
ncbi:efflux RND transporter periplasmic adaptor subunit [Shewanella inventionis]|uniref:Hemolysin secretion protein D n=1 Tax=Shewanella inventionis TaxID=1738770 RepID=A0ABQ1ITP0_9GAMM|nr:efflux RND transporter periplasmic adaptor subunit [Shewanella inventionis]MCL1156890.1 efflux RND transporter periplasmic adaptor subunit [Shewanella inventionis]UAL45176.1 efflux RND transporter periplasmic adaptor subunit [Shewanella inventionis]GGB50931.1 hemolysin secretion protein D [Shewanella inventionis]